MKSKEIGLRIYSLLRQNKDYGFRDQICKAYVSIMNNIAEGFERRSDKEFRHFLIVAKGLCGEVRSMLHPSFALNYPDKSEYSQLVDQSNELSQD